MHVPLVQGGLRSVVKSVAADSVLGNLLQDDDSSTGSDGPVRRTARMRSSADEALAEPSPAAGVNRRAPIKALSGTARNFEGESVQGGNEKVQKGEPQKRQLRGILSLAGRCTGLQMARADSRAASASRACLLHLLGLETLVHRQM